MSVFINQSKLPASRNPFFTKLNWNFRIDTAANFCITESILYKSSNANFQIWDWNFLYQKINSSQLYHEILVCRFLLQSMLENWFFGPNSCQITNQINWMHTLIVYIFLCLSKFKNHWADYDLIHITLCPCWF